MESKNVAAVPATVELIDAGEPEELLDRFVAELDHTRSLSPDAGGRRPDRHQRGKPKS